jgi:alpha-pyrone synthase
VLSFLVFADGCAASLVTAQKKGLAIDSFLALNIPQTSGLITWRVGDLDSTCIFPERFQERSAVR